MNDKEIQSLINILQEAKGSSESFKKGRLMDCYNDLKGMIQDDLDLIEKRKAEIALSIYRGQTKNMKYALQAINKDNNLTIDKQ